GTAGDLRRPRRARSRPDAPTPGRAHSRMAQPARNDPARSSAGATPRAGEGAEPRCATRSEQGDEDAVGARFIAPTRFVGATACLARCANGERSARDSRRGIESPGSINKALSGCKYRRSREGEQVLIYNTRLVECLFG